MPPDDPPRDLKSMLSEAKGTSELMVDLAYAGLFFGDAQMADRPVELLAGDELIASGPEEGRARLAELGGSRVLEDDATGEIALVRVDT